MIKVNCKDGKTISFDLASEEDVKKWESLSSEKEFVNSITGISILYNTYWHTLPLPKKFRNIRFHAKLVKSAKGGVEKIVGERIVCQADDIQISVITYYGNRPKMTRIDIRRIGKIRYIPPKRRVGNGINN